MTDKSSPHPLIDLAWIRQASGFSDLSVDACMREHDRVGANALFDVDFYRKSYGRDIPSGMSCLEHFCRQPRNRFYDPNPLFSVRQWHETIGWQLPADSSWRHELFAGLGCEARFAREEMVRQASRNVILSDIESGVSPKPGQEICLFIHFDANDQVQPYVQRYLAALRDQGVCILFLTNSSHLDPEAIDLLKRYAWRIVCTNNRAYDWGLYAVGTMLIDDLGYRGHPLIMANDSVVGTMNSLAPLFDMARNGPYQITGAVDSLLHDWHVQSFFIYCRADVLTSSQWTGFWQAYRPAYDRWFVVNAQEMGFCRWMRRHGISMGAVWQYDTLLKNAEDIAGSEWRRSLVANGQVTNPTIELWDILLKAGFPFLKRAVLTTPLLSGNIKEISNLIGPWDNACSPDGE